MVYLPAVYCEGEPTLSICGNRCHGMDHRDLYIYIFMAKFYLLCLQTGDPSAWAWRWTDPNQHTTCSTLSLLAFGFSLQLMATGTDYLLYIGGWLDLTKGPLILHVPDFSERYYSLQFTDPSTGENFAYVGKRTTETQAGDYLITGPGWQGSSPQGMKGISSPNRSILVVGRVLVEDDSAVVAAYDLAKQVRLNPLSW